MEKEFEYTVYEYKEKGTRFYSSYNPNGETDKLKIIGHCNSDVDARALCDVTRAANFASFFESMSPFLNYLDEQEKKQ